MEKNAKIYVAGHNGMVGSAIIRKLKKEGYNNLIYRTSKELDLKNQIAVNEFFNIEKPEYVIVAAAKVGGILANNTQKADFLYDNLMIEANVIHAAFVNKVKKLLFLGSSCIYPKASQQPIKEEYLLTGHLEPTNDAYAIAKITGIKLCEAYRAQHGCNFISAMPTNLYGPNDNYNLKSSHVLPALIRKFYDAKENAQEYVEIWGTGKPRREFLHVDDLAEACFYLMINYNEAETINVGTGNDVSIKELAELIKDTICYKGELIFNTEMPDGMFRKLLDVSKINNHGWKHKTELAEGIKITIQDFIENKEKYLKS